MDAAKNVRFSKGYVLSLLVIGIPAVTWAASYSFSESLYTNISMSLAKTAAFAGMATFGWSLILSARYKVFDTLFGGLDKMYTAHRLFGTLSVALLILHPIGLTFARLPTAELSSLKIWYNYYSIGLLLGQVALYGLIGLVIWSVFSRVRHETYIRVHRLLGLLFVAGALHAFISGSILGDGAFLYWYMLVLSGFATASYAHYSFLNDFLHAHYNYIVDEVNELPGDIIELCLKPKRRIMKFQPGQFVYMEFERLAIHGFHPFTIASGTRTSHLQFLIKKQGDLTESLSQLKAGDLVKVRGPYGRFLLEDKKYEKQLWVAGGIGITPFLSKARSLRYNHAWPQIDLVYATKTKQEAAVLGELERLQQQVRSFNVTHLRENKFGIVSLHDIKEHFGTLEDRAIFICGPPAMLQAYQGEAEELGVEGQLHFEEFNY